MTAPVLDLCDLVKRFGSLVAVDGVSLSIPPGEHHAIIGPNGAGKTTLFDLVTGAVSPTDGRILFEGQDVTALREDERARRGIVRSFQFAELFGERSIQDNLRLAVQSNAQDFNPFGTPDPDLLDRATEWLDVLGIDADPTTEAKTLSHGDRKRLEVGMAMAADPTLLLLDEPTSGVPDDESDALVDSISDVSENRSVLLIEHDVDLALEFADRVTVMARGSVIAQGPPETIVNDESVQEAYLGGYRDTALD